MTGTSRPYDGQAVGGSRAEARFRSRVARSLGPRLSPRARVLLFSTVLAAAGLATFVLTGSHVRSDASAPISIPWPIFAVSFFLSEVKVIDVHFRRETHSFSLGEVPTVLGLFFVEPRMYILGRLLAATAAFVIARKPASKTYFNVSYFLLSSTLGLAVFQAIAPHSGMPGPLDWVAAFVATSAMSVIGALAIGTVISLSGAGPQFQRLPQMLQVGVLFAATNTALALLAVDVLWADARAIWLVAVPVGTLFLAYRAYLAERQKHESLELLYESSRIFQRSPELDSAIVAMLEHARLMFRSDRAEVVLHAGPDSAPVRTSVGPGASTEVMVSASDRAALLDRLAADGRPFIYVPGLDLPAAGTRLFRFAMVSPLRGESGSIGAMIVADRSDDSDQFGPDELRLLETVANQTAIALENGQLERSLSELSRLQGELERQAYHDSLTGLANRTVFLHALESQLGAPEPEGLPAVLFLDLDDFKIINDTVGHSTGDRVLQAVADRMRGCVRQHDLAARLGGDEFAILMDRAAGGGDAAGVAERVSVALSHPFEIAGREFVVSASIGIARGQPGQRAEELLRNADVAMYTAKARGKGQVAWWEPDMHAAIVERHELSAELSRAIVRNQLDVYYQPLVDLRTERIVGFEALARWIHPVRGPVPPDAFISMAEETGTIAQLGRQVLERACRDAVGWLGLEGLERLTLNVNISPKQVQRAEFIDDVRAILRASGLDPVHLMLEMTETAMFRDLEGAIEKLESLRQAGLRLAVDDFGTGYSSLRYLSRFPIDELKIAKEFLATGAADDLSIAQAIIALGRSLRLRVVAEGVETPQQLAALRQLGCDLGQGYLFSRPVPAAAVRELVSRLNDKAAPVPLSRAGELPTTVALRPLAGDPPAG
ncbi:MAG TPA: EAL domain-containing protein [Candidatus Limnocylindrales bacterium]